MQSSVCVYMLRHAEVFVFTGLIVGNYTCTQHLISNHMMNGILSILMIEVILSFSSSLSPLHLIPLLSWKKAVYYVYMYVYHQ